MFYKPKYCNECGEKIVRTDWSIKHSRQFCDLCQTEHQVTDWVHRGSALLVPVLLIGCMFAFFKSGTPNDARQTRNLTSPAVKKDVPAQTGISPAESRRTEETQPNTSTVKTPAPTATAPGEFQEQRARTVKSSEERVYYCGAPTKKGTPCSRRVKTPGYCWQHRDKAE